MNINLKFLLLGTSLSLIPNLLYAQCVATTDCATLGYTETSCPNGKGLRCPFGNTFACPATDESVCEKNGFKHTCTGTGYTGGVGQSCNKQFASCSCSSGYTWKDDKCEKQIVDPSLGTCSGKAKNCSIGQILNSDGTCTTDKINGKNPLGVIVAIRDNRGYAMTADPIQKNTTWSTENIQASAFLSPDLQLAIKDYNARSNMTMIIQEGGADSYPAAYAALNYAPNEAPTTKGKWMLPSTGILKSLYTNKSIINSAISKLNGKQLTDSNEFIWSSSEYNLDSVWVFSVRYNTSYGLEGHLKSNGHTIRPVIEF